jgi:hypothetical protein
MKKIIANPGCEPYEIDTIEDEQEDTKYTFPIATISQILIGAIGIGIVLLVGYIIINKMQNIASSLINRSTYQLSNFTNIGDINVGISLIAFGIITLMILGLISILNCRSNT